MTDNANDKKRLFVIDGADLHWGRSIRGSLQVANNPNILTRSIVGEGAETESGENTFAQNPNELPTQEFMKKALDGAETLVLARRLIDANTPLSTEALSLLVKRTEAMVAAAVEMGVQYIVYIGLAGMHKRTGDAIANCELATEKCVSEVKLPTLIIRSCPVANLGEGRLRDAEKRIRDGCRVMLFPAQGAGRTAPITEDDFGEAVCDAITHRREGLISIGGPELLTALEIYNRIEERVSRAIIKLHIPNFVYSLTTMLSKLMGKTPARELKLDWYFQDMIPDRETSKELLGREPKPFEEVYDKEAK